MEENKPTYEELQALVEKQAKEIEAYKGLNNQLYQQVMRNNMTNLYKRLDYLFKVVDSNCTYFDIDFIEKCVEEITQIMTPEEPKAEEE